MEEMIERYNKLLVSTGRKGIQDLINALTISGFYKSPCSTMHHLNHEGGLLEHSLNVYDIAWKMYTGLELKSIPFDSIIISALCHDVGKSGQYDKPLYEPNFLKGGNVSEKKPYVLNKKLQYVPHEVVSLQTVSKYIELTELEQHSILYHGTLYSDLKLAYNGHETPLSMVIGFADLWSTRVTEAIKEDLF